MPRTGRDLPALGSREDRIRPRTACWLAGGLLLILAASGPGLGCTAFVMKGWGGTLLARNLDWPVGDGYVFVNKKNVAKVAFPGESPLSLRWTSKYGSITFNQFGREFPRGGMNTAGLVVEALGAPSEYSPPDRQPFLNEFQWVQYQLDNHASVKEVLNGNSRLRISKLLAGLHYLLADRQGHTAVIDFVKGRMVVYSGRDFPVRILAERPYAESLRRLRGQQGFGGQSRVSSSPPSGEGFIRAAALLEDFDLPGQRPSVDTAFSILRSVAQKDNQWSIVYNPARGFVFFKTRVSRRLKIIALEDFDFRCARPVLMLPVLTEGSGRLRRRFDTYDPQKNRRLLETVFSRLHELGEIAAPLSQETIRKMAEYPEECPCR